MILPLSLRLDHVLCMGLSYLAGCASPVIETVALQDEGWDLGFLLVVDSAGSVEGAAHTVDLSGASGTAVELLPESEGSDGYVLVGWREADQTQRTIERIDHDPLDASLVRADVSGSYPGDGVHYAHLDGNPRVEFELLKDGPHIDVREGSLSERGLSGAAYASTHLLRFEGSSDFCSDAERLLPLDFYDPYVGTATPAESAVRFEPIDEDRLLVLTRDSMLRRIIAGVPPSEDEAFSLAVDSTGRLFDIEDIALDPRVRADGTRRLYAVGLSGFASDPEPVATIIAVDFSPDRPLSTSTSTVLFTRAGLPISNKDPHFYSVAVAPNGDVVAVGGQDLNTQGEDGFMFFRRGDVEEASFERVDVRDLNGKINGRELSWVEAAVSPRGGSLFVIEAVSQQFVRLERAESDAIPLEVGRARIQDIDQDFTGMTIKVTDMLIQPKDGDVEVWAVGQQGLVWRWHSDGSQELVARKLVEPGFMDSSATECGPSGVLASSRDPASLAMYDNRLYVSYDDCLGIFVLRLDEDCGGGVPVGDELRPIVSKNRDRHTRIDRWGDRIVASRETPTGLLIDVITIE